VHKVIKGKQVLQDPQDHLVQQDHQVQEAQVALLGQLEKEGTLVPPDLPDQQGHQERKEPKVN
jgi:hypothetical protein